MPSGTENTLAKTSQDHGNNERKFLSGVWSWSSNIFENDNFYAPILVFSPVFTALGSICLSSQIKSNSPALQTFLNIGFMMASTIIHEQVSDYTQRNLLSNVYSNSITVFKNSKELPEQSQLAVIKHLHNVAQTSDTLSHNTLLMMNGFSAGLGSAYYITSQLLQQNYFAATLGATMTALQAGILYESLDPSENLKRASKKLTNIIKHNPQSPPATELKDINERIYNATYEVNVFKAISAGLEALTMLIGTKGAIPSLKQALPQSGLPAALPPQWLQVSSLSKWIGASGYKFNDFLVRGRDVDHSILEIERIFKENGVDMKAKHQTSSKELKSYDQSEDINFFSAPWDNLGNKIIGFTKKIPDFIALSYHNNGSIDWVTSSLSVANIAFITARFKLLKNLKSASYGSSYLYQSSIFIAVRVLEEIITGKIQNKGGFNLRNNIIDEIEANKYDLSLAANKKSVVKLLSNAETILPQSSVVTISLTSGSIATLDFLTSQGGNKLLFGYFISSMATQIIGSLYYSFSFYQAKDAVFKFSSEFVGHTSYNDNISDTLEIELDNIMSAYKQISQVKMLISGIGSFNVILDEQRAISAIDTIFKMKIEKPQEALKPYSEIIKFYGGNYYKITDWGTKLGFVVEESQKIEKPKTTIVEVILEDNNSTSLDLSTQLNGVCEASEEEVAS